ncbi:MAG: thioredoxin-dependent thiol peroxidase [Opitutales bacterium]
MEQTNPLGEGDEAPSFSFREADGKERSTPDLAGSPYLVYFYPRDNTPGCTAEACGFRDNLPALIKLGLTVIGVSCDSEKSHEKFRAKHDLPFPLASDESREIVKAFGVWGEKSFMGRKFAGIHRMSFLIGPDGKIAKAYHKVKAKTHPDQVLSDARELLG